MYITFLAKKINNPSLEELLSNPYINNSDITEYKPVTKVINEEKAKEYFDNSTLDYNLTSLRSIINIPKELIPNFYSHFNIPKKSNPKEKRPIDAPFGNLRTNQEILKNEIMYVIKFIPHRAAHAYVEKKSIVTALQKHQDNNSKWYFQTDIKSFFPSINEAFIRETLPKVYPFKFLDPKIIDYICKYGLLEDKLPQGSPLSPLLTNILMVPIDYEIDNLLNNYNKHHYVYTRYADDITISCKQKFNPDKMERKIKEIFRSNNAPFIIKTEKTRFGSIAGKNYHLGLIVNAENKIALGHSKNKQLRALLYDFCVRSTTDINLPLEYCQQTQGRIAHYFNIEPEYTNRMLKKYNSKFGINIMQILKSKTSP